MIYLDSAATSIYKPESVYEEVIKAMKSYGNPGRSAGKYSMDAGRCIYEARELLTVFFGGDDPSRLIFTANATQSLNMAIKGICKSGDHIITTRTEHNSVLRPLYQMEKLGCQISIVDVDEKGKINPLDIKAEIRDNTKLIVCNHASNVTGNINDINEIGKIAREAGILFLVDASQSAGFVDINVKEMNIDLLAFTGHKGLMGPQGTGGLYINSEQKLNKEIEIEPLISGGTGVYSFLKSQPDAYPEHLEAGTLNGHGIAGLKTAIEYINDIGLEAIHRKESELAGLFYREVAGIEGLNLYGDYSDINNRCPLVSLNIGNVDSGEVSEILEENYLVQTRSGIHCAPLIHERLGTRTQGAVRFSFSYFNTKEEILCATKAVREIAKEVL